jgi:hypothetical protein
MMLAPAVLLDGHDEHQHDLASICSEHVGGDPHDLALRRQPGRLNVGVLPPPGMQLTTGFPTNGGPWRTDL